MKTEKDKADFAIKVITTGIIASAAFLTAMAVGYSRSGEAPENVGPSETEMAAMKLTEPVPESP